MQIEKNAKGQVVFDKEKLTRKKDRKEITVYQGGNGVLYITPSDANRIFGRVNSVFVIDSDSKMNYCYSKLLDGDLEVLEEEYDINYQPLRKKDDGIKMKRTFDDYNLKKKKELETKRNKLNEQRIDIEKLLKMLDEKIAKIENEHHNDYDSGQGYGM